MIPVSLPLRSDSAHRVPAREPHTDDMRQRVEDLRAAEAAHTPDPPPAPLPPPLVTETADPVPPESSHYVSAYGYGAVRDASWRVPRISNTVTRPNLARMMGPATG